MSQKWLPGSGAECHRYCGSFRRRQRGGVCGQSRVAPGGNRALELTERGQAPHGLPLPCSQSAEPRSEETISSSRYHSLVQPSIHPIHPFIQQLFPQLWLHVPGSGDVFVRQKGSLISWNSVVGRGVIKHQGQGAEKGTWPKG